MTRPFELIETMRWEMGIARLDRHLKRLIASAAFFGIELDLNRVRREVDAVCVRCEGSGVAWRVRLSVNDRGQSQVTVEAIEYVPGVPRRVAMSPSRIDARDIFRRHKTSRRELYDEEYARAAKEGWFEVLYTNEEGFVAEGSRTNVFVESAGTLLTPPVRDGALPGVYRSELLELADGVHEARLTKADLVSSDRILVCNAVIGLVEVELIDSLAPQSDSKTLV